MHVPISPARTSPSLIQWGFTKHHVGIHLASATIQVAIGGHRLAVTACTPGYPSVHPSRVSHLPRKHAAASTTGGTTGRNGNANIMLTAA